MIGYRPASRIFAGVTTAAFIFVSIYIMFAPGSQIRIGGLVFATFAVVVLRGGYRPAVKIEGETLVVDQPAWRWRIPRVDIEGVSARQGTITITTNTTTIIPFTFSHSLIANLINGDKHRMAAVEAVNDWRHGAAPTRTGRPATWSVKPVLLDAVVLIGGWQVAYSLVLLLQGG